MTVDTDFDLDIDDIDELTARILPVPGVSPSRQGPGPSEGPNSTVAARHESPDKWPSPTLPTEKAYTETWTISLFRSRKGQRQQRRRQALYLTWTVGTTSHHQHQPQHQGPCRPSDLISPASTLNPVGCFTANCVAIDLHQVEAFTLLYSTPFCHLSGCCRRRRRLSRCLPFAPAAADPRFLFSALQTTDRLNWHPQQVDCMVQDLDI